MPTSNKKRITNMAYDPSTKTLTITFKNIDSMTDQNAASLESLAEELEQLENVDDDSEFLFYLSLDGKRADVHLGAMTPPTELFVAKTVELRATERLRSAFAK